MARRDDDGKAWGYLVLASMIILAVIFIFKIIFWVSLAGIVVGLIWLYIERDGDPTYPAVLFIVCLVMAPVSWYIGYGFEQTPFGSSVVNTAETIVQTDKTIKDVPKNIENNMTEVLTKSLPP